MKTSFLVSLLVYLIFSFTLFKLYQKAGLKSAFYAFIPILGTIPFFHAINRSAWNFLWLLVPLANIYFSIRFQIEFLRAYGQNDWAVLVYIFLPPLGLIHFLFMAFHKDVEFEGQVYQK
jgi:hypothetical protein